MNIPGTESVRFRRPTTGPNAAKAAAPEKDQFGSMAPQGWKRRHQGLLQDLLGRQRRGPWVPSFSLAVRLLLLIRTAAAMYSVIADCDEVFNFYEPLHYFIHNSGFQTWELSPQYAVRSWAYILFHYPLTVIAPHIAGMGKRQQFFCLRLVLGLISTMCEARFYRTVVVAVNERVGRYVLFGLMLSAGMWNASISFLPSSFAMHANMLAASFWFHPATSTKTGTRRAILATFFIGLGAILGWPFAAALGVPFVFEFLFLAGGEIVPPSIRAIWARRRLNVFLCAFAIAAAVAIPAVLVDSWAYGYKVIPNLNIITYNLFSKYGPDLYGTEPASFYFKNLFLNFNLLLPFSLITLPALAITYKYDFRRLGKTQMLPKEGESSPYLLLVTRLAPFYIWLAILSCQSHKEERFMYPAYPFLVFNATVSIYLIKGWMEKIYIDLTLSPYRAAQSSIFSWFTFLTIFVSCVLGISRIVGLYKWYHAPFDAVFHFEYTTLPNYLQDLGYPHLPLPPVRPGHENDPIEPEWDLNILKELAAPLTLCYGSEWHRFPSSFLVPDGVNVEFIRSEFDGMMPRKWNQSSAVGYWPRAETRVVHPGRFNAANQESAEPGTYVPISQCDYLVALNLPSQEPTKLQPDYVNSPEWEHEFCTTFLDAASSKWWARWFWEPVGLGEDGRVYGEYCLLRKKE